MPFAAIYARVSSPQQKVEQTIASQTEDPRIALSVMSQLLGVKISSVGGIQEQDPIFGDSLIAEIDLEKKLAAFRAYYNQHRVHSSLDGRTPGEVSGERVNAHTVLHDFCWRTHCRGLHELPVAA